MTYHIQNIASPVHRVSMSLVRMAESSILFYQICGRPSSTSTSPSFISLNKGKYRKMNMYHIYGSKNIGLYYTKKMSLTLIAIPLLLIAILYIVFFRVRNTSSKLKNTSSKPMTQEGRRTSLEERVRRRMGKSS